MGGKGLAVGLYFIPLTIQPDDWGIPKYPTEEEFAKLPEKERDKIPFLPLMESSLLEKNKSLKKLNSKDKKLYVSLFQEAFVLQIEEGLSDLKFYQGIPKGKSSAELTQAIKDFQKFINHDPTGILTYGEHTRLFNDVKRGVFQKISIHDNAEINFKKDDHDKPFVHILNRPQYDPVSAEGTWILEGEEIADTLNSCKIKCTRNNSTCVVSKARIMGLQSTPPSDGDGELTLMLDLDFYDILKWNEKEIVAEIEHDGIFAHSTETITIDLRTKEVFSVTRRKWQDSEHKESNLDTPKFARLVGRYKRVFGKKRSSLNSKIRLTLPPCPMC